MHSLKLGSVVFKGVDFPLDVVDLLQRSSTHLFSQFQTPSFDQKARSELPRPPHFGNGRLGGVPQNIRLAAPQGTHTVAGAVTNLATAHHCPPFGIRHHTTPPIPPGASRRRRRSHHLRVPHVGIPRSPRGLRRVCGYISEDAPGVAAIACATPIAIGSPRGPSIPFGRRVLIDAHCCGRSVQMCPSGCAAFSDPVYEPGRSLSKRERASGVVARSPVCYVTSRGAGPSWHVYRAPYLGRIGSKSRYMRIVKVSSPYSPCTLQFVAMGETEPFCFYHCGFSLLSSQFRKLNGRQFFRVYIAAVSVVS